MQTVSSAILSLKKEEKKELSEDELRQLILKVCALTGIKEEGLPSKEIVSVCLNIFNTRYLAQMNKLELGLAFELNMTGDLIQKEGDKIIQHFQCFSAEYFCEVCTAYLRKKRSVAVAVKNKDEEKADIGADKFRESQIAVLEDILEDFKDYHTKEEVDGYREPKQALKFKMEILNQIVDIDFSEENIMALREKAAKAVLRQAAKKKQEARSVNKFGLEMEMANQIARIKEGKLITQSDEMKIQHEVSQLLYYQVFEKHKPKFGQSVEQSDFYMHLSEAKKEC